MSGLKVPVKNNVDGSQHDDASVHSKHDDAASVHSNHDASVHSNHDASVHSKHDDAASVHSAAGEKKEPTMQERVNTYFAAHPELTPPTSAAFGAPFASWSEFSSQAKKPFELGYNNGLDFATGIIEIFKTFGAMVRDLISGNFDNFKDSEEAQGHGSKLLTQLADTAHSLFAAIAYPFWEIAALVSRSVMSMFFEPKPIKLTQKEREEIEIVDDVSSVSSASAKI